MYGNVGVVLVHFRAAQKLNLSSSPHRRRRSGDENIGSDEQPIFPNGYAALLLKSPPPAPPALLRRIGVKELTGVGKVSSHHFQIDLSNRRESVARSLERVRPIRQFGGEDSACSSGRFKAESRQGFRSSELGTGRSPIHHRYSVVLDSIG